MLNTQKNVGMGLWVSIDSAFVSTLCSEPTVSLYTFIILLNFTYKKNKVVSLLDK